VLKQHSFKAVTKKKKPLLTAVHRKKRLAFALKHREWTVEDWKRVMWSDETKINRIGSDGKQWVWKKAGDGLIEREVQGTVKFGGGNIMVLSHPVTNPLPRTHASRMSDVSSLVTPHVDKDTLYPTSCRTHVL
jgi:hypothetical protein